MKFYQNGFHTTQYTFVALSAIGTVAAAITQQALYATVPLTLALSLNFNNNKRLEQQIQNAIATTDQIKLINEKSTKQEVDDLQQVAEHLQQQFVNYTLEKQTSFTDIIHQIAELKHSIVNFQQDTNQGNLTELQNKLQVLEQENEQHFQQNQNLEKFIENLQIRYQIVGHLASEIRELKQQKRHMSQQLNHHLHDLETKLSFLDTHNQELVAQIQVLESSIQSKDSINLEDTQYLLNDFENLVKLELQKDFPQQAILTQFDVGSSGESSKCVDFAVITPNCIIVIEAKGYKGKITAHEPRNARWLCQTKKQSIKVNACWGENPYKQVKVYVDSFLQYLRTANSELNNIPVYGVVVFPKDAQIDFNVKAAIGGYFKVTTLNQLLTTISSLNEQAINKNRSNLSSTTVIKILNETSDKIAA